MPRLGAQRPPAHPVLRVLVVEDNPLDAELVVAILKRAGFPVSFEVVDAPAAFERALAQWSPDLVLCDHNLRTWTGFDALTTLKTSGKDVPLIVVTADPLFGQHGDRAWRREKANLNLVANFIKSLPKK